MVNAAVKGKRGLLANGIRMLWLAGYEPKFVKGGVTKGAKRKLTPGDIARYEAAQNRRNLRAARS